VPNYKLSKNVYFEKICWVVQCIMMSQTNLTILIYLIYLSVEHVVAYLVEALRYKLEDHGFDS
jgi:hypothetical protein